MSKKATRCAKITGAAISGVGEKKAVKQQLFKGNEYWFWLGTEVEKANLSVHIYDAEGKLVEQPDSWQKGQFAAAHIVPQTTGSYFIIVTIEESPDERTHWALGLRLPLVLERRLASASRPGSEARSPRGRPSINDRIPHSAIRERARAPGALRERSQALEDARGNARGARHDARRLAEGGRRTGANRSRATRLRSARESAAERRGYSQTRIQLRA